MTLKIVADKKVEARSDAAEIADMLQGFADRVRSGEVGATNAVVMIVDKSSMSTFDVDYDVYGDFLTALGVADFLKARVMEDILE